MSRKTLSPVDKAYWEARARTHIDARNSTSNCPLMGTKVQLLPLRYGRVERLHNPSDTDGYRDLKRPLGLRLVRDGYLYVIAAICMSIALKAAYRPNCSGRTGKSLRMSGRPRLASTP